MNYSLPTILLFFYKLKYMWNILPTYLEHMYRPMHLHQNYPWSGFGTQFLPLIFNCGYGNTQNSLTGGIFTIASTEYNLQGSFTTTKFSHTGWYVLS